MVFSKGFDKASVNREKENKMSLSSRSPLSKTLVPALTAALVAITSIAAADPSFEYLGFDESQLSPEARDGLHEIYSGRMFYSAIPLALSQALAAAEAERKDELGYDPTTAEGKFFSSGSLPSPPTRENEADPSLGQVIFERDGAMLAGFNCFECHAGVVDGKVIAGLGSTSVMQRPPRPEGTAGPNMFALAAAVKTPEERAVMASMMKTSKSVSSPVAEVTNRGDNYGPFAVWAHGAQLEDPARKGLEVTYEKTELTDLIENNVAPPVNPMPWWLMKYKTRDYWYSDGNPFDAAHFSFNFTGQQDNANDYHASHVASTAKALAFARETQSPLFPGDLDADLVKQGADLFHGRTLPSDVSAFKTCAECHGSYTKIGANPDYSQPGSWLVEYDGDLELKNVRTDSAYNEIVQTLRPISEHINKLSAYYLAQETPELAPHFDHLEGKGYVPPPLVGVWATGPYFHNGSVPTVEAVLNSELRPEIWKRDQSPHAYDRERLGFVSTPLTREQYEEAAAVSAAAP